MPQAAARPGEMNVLYRLADELNRASDPDAVYRVALEGVRRALAVERASVLTFDPDGVMRFKASAGLSAEYCAAVEGHTPWRPGEKDATPITVEDVEGDASLAGLREVLATEGIRALAFIPLLGRDGVLGKFMVYHGLPHSFSGAELRLAEAIATHVAVAAERARADAVRREQADRLAEQAALLDLAHDAIFTLTLDGVIEFWNSGAERLYGWSAAEARGKIVHDLLRTAFPVPLPSILDSLLREGFWEGDIVHTTRDGRRLDISSRWALRRGADGAPRGMLEIARDITREKRAQQQVANVLSSIRESFIALDRDFRFTFVNDRVVEQVGIPREQILGRNIWETVPESANSAFLPNYRRVMEERVPARFEVAYAPLDRYFEVHAYPTDEGLCAYILDITDRRAAEVALRESEERYRSLAAALSSVVWTASPSGAFTAPQPGWEQYTGQNREQYREWGWLDAFCPEDRERLKDVCAGAIERGERYSLESRLWHDASGRYRVCIVTGVPIAAPQGEIREWVGTVTDIDDRRQFEKKLRESAKLESLGVLAGGIAHDFNNLLTGVLGCASLLMDEIGPQSPMRAAVEVIAHASERASKLTRQMLAYSGRGHFVVEALSLSVQVRQILALLQASIPKHVHLVLEFDDAAPTIEADSGQLQQLVMNLIINAAEAIPTEGVVTVTTGVERFSAPRQTIVGELPPGTYVFLRIRDTGTGMDEATRSRIFDPFFTTKFTGRGLGLAAVLGIVKGHRAGIEVESTLGAGTVFTVLFPAATRAVSVVEPAPESKAVSGGTVLVVDDEPIVLRTASAVLQRAGYRVWTAASGAEALAQLAEHRGAISLVILDMTMPGMSGEETLRLLRVTDPNVNVLGSSGYSEQEARRRFGAGLVGFLQKPYTIAQLSGRVAAAMQPGDAGPAPK